jgi:hypothetical protein
MTADSDPIISDEDIIQDEGQGRKAVETNKRVFSTIIENLKNLTNECEVLKVEAEK